MNVFQHHNLDFSEVYREFQPKILRYLSRLAGQNEAEDIAQEVFTKISRNLGSFKGDSKLSTWIYRIATNAAVDRFRSLSFKQMADHTPLEEKHEVTGNNIWTGHREPLTDRQVIQKEMSQCIRDHIDKLPPHYRTVIILSEIEEFKNREIADILQLSLDTVKIRLHRARALLKKILEESCHFYHNEQNILSCDRKSKPPPVEKKSQ